MSRTGFPDAPACARNREPILAHLRRLFANCKQVLEVGSGTGQHAVYFAPRLSHLTWHTSDRAEYLSGIRAWLAAEPAENLREPLQLDVSGEWPALALDAIFTANTLHIMSAQSVQDFFRALPQVLEPGGLLVVYGPVKIDGAFVGPTNEDFDRQLRQRDPHSGIRDLEWLDRLAQGAGLVREELNDLPANNQLMVWRRVSETEGSSNA
ncbi:DUF938 domain-containing protein [Microbulbifer hainanensis]|uniref:DUF938 domain-containing protein n=1 Tax=Microbulbifer hainanensis TaxID=2735675 RepID=UPI0018661C84|nr:DUF938 domain-containing protein [Microbulbifer hainanensis]